MTETSNKHRKVLHLLNEFEHEYCTKDDELGLDDIDHLAQIFRELFHYAKREEDLKTKIGLHTGANVIRFTHPRYPYKVNFEAALLLRSLTVTAKVKKALLNHCVSVYEVLVAQQGNAKIEVLLTACVWNLSSYRPNRDQFCERTQVLDYFGKQLLRGGEIQNETAGALRNFTVSIQHVLMFPDTKVIENELFILKEIESGTRLMGNVIQTLRNLTVHDKNRTLMQNNKSIAVLADTLKRLDNKYHLCWMLELLGHLMKGSDVPEIMMKLDLQETLIALAEGEEAIARLARPMIEALESWKLPEGGECQSTKARNQARASATARRSQTAVLANGMLEKLNLDDTINLDDVTMIKAIGEGSFGTVYLAEYHNFPVACKLVKAGINEDNVGKIMEELRVMRRLKHPNVVMLMGACFTKENNLMIITELAGRGDMKTVLKDVNTFTLQWELVHGAAKGLNWLQSYNIIHRDLKLDNLLVTEDWTVKITDFGLSIELGEGQSYGNWGGNVKYAAPELLAIRYPHLVPGRSEEQQPQPEGTKREYPYSEKTDIYSFGLIWWQILTKRDPFLPRAKEFKGGKEPLARYILSAPRKPPIPSSWPTSLEKTLNRCWDQDPACRPTFSQILDEWDFLTIDLLCCDPLGKKIGYTMLERFGKKTKFPTFRRLFLEECMTKPKLYLQDRILLENLLRL